MERTYTAVIERDIESGWLIASVVELPGCNTQAPDEQSLDENIADAIRVYLDGEDLEEDDEALTEYVGTKRLAVNISTPQPA